MDIIEHKTQNEDWWSGK